jgi:hypothetical protein
VFIDVFARCVNEWECVAAHSCMGTSEEHALTALAGTWPLHRISDIDTVRPIPLTPTFLNPRANCSIDSGDHINLAMAMTHRHSDDGNPINTARAVSHIPYEPYVQYCHMGAIYWTIGPLEL